MSQNFDEPKKKKQAPKRFSCWRILLIGVLSLACVGIVLYFVIEISSFRPKYWIAFRQDAICAKSTPPRPDENYPYYGKIDLWHPDHLYYLHFHEGFLIYTEHVIACTPDGKSMGYLNEVNWGDTIRWIEDDGKLFLVFEYEYRDEAATYYHDADTLELVRTEYR